MDLYKHNSCILHIGISSKTNNGRWSLCLHTSVFQLQDRTEDTDSLSWEEDLADVFVIDSAGDFKRISGPGVRLHHVFHVTRKIQEQLGRKKSFTAGMMDMTLNHKEFANILDAGRGLTIQDIYCVVTCAWGKMRSYHVERASKEDWKRHEGS